MCIASCWWAVTYADCGAAMQNVKREDDVTCDSVHGRGVRRLAATAVVAVVALCGLAILAVDQLVLGRPDVAVAHSDSDGAAAATSAHAVLYDDWQESISRDSTWRSRGSAGSGWNPASRNSRNRPSHLQGPPPQPGWFVTPPGNVLVVPPPQHQMGQPGWPGGPNSKSSRQVSGYRTVCVRQCDGYFFPISFGASEASFSRDQTTCTNACPGARLYYYRPSSQDPEDMVDLSGQKYSRLKTADLFRTQYIESCKCKPHPWEQEAVDRHRVYALENLRRKGNRAVVAELELLKTKNRLNNQSTTRRRPADRRRTAQPDDSAGATSSAATVAQSTAPRSDVNRGQGAERSMQAASSILTGAISASASAATVAAVTAPGHGRSVASEVPLPGVQQTTAEQQSSAVGSAALLEGAADLVNRAVAPAIAEMPAVAPEPTLVPTPPVVVEKSRTGRSSSRRGRTSQAGKRPDGMMRLRASNEGSAVGPPSASNRQRLWTAQIFGN